MQKDTSIIFMDTYAHRIGTPQDFCILPLLRCTMTIPIRQKGITTGARPGRGPGVFRTCHDKIRGFAGEWTLRGPHRRIAAYPADQIQTA
jgi:hypothetical protein